MDWHKVTADGSADRDPSQLRAPLLTAAYATWAVLLCLHLLHTLSGPWPAPLPRLLDPNEETSIYTWLSVLMLGIAGLLMLDIGFRTPRSDRILHWGWIGVGLAVLAVSADEMLMIHEGVAVRLHEHFQWGGYLRFAWVVPAILVVALGGLLALPFLARLPSSTRGWMFAAAVVFVVGAVGIEMIGGKLWDDGMEDSLAYALVSGTEEAFEGLGVLILLGGLLRHRRMDPGS